MHKELLLAIALNVQGNLVTVGDVLSGYHLKSAVTKQLHRSCLRFEESHVHAEADPRSRLEDGELVLRRRCKRDPSFWAESLGFWVSFWIPAHVIGAVSHLCQGWHFPPSGQDVVFKSHLRVDRHRRPKPKSFVDDAMQVWHFTGRQALHVQFGSWRQLLHDLVMKPRLNVWVPGEFVERPRQQASRGVSASNNQMQDHLLHEVGAELRLNEECQQIPSLGKLWIITTLLDQAIGLPIEHAAC
mmetsp:Transcript_62366/g.146394  ORF Transcript_62366/g.146394 Transcript_62366/m.146394 type:complete len:243 (-) Transcript_62366:986-1714(-)